MWLMTYFLIKIIHEIAEAVNEKNILMKTVCSIYAHQYSRKWWRLFFKMAAFPELAP